MKVSDYIALRLAEVGIDTAFLVQGAANNDLIYSVADQPGMRYVCAMHEQGAGFMAEGWSKAKELPGLAIATSGPGGQNLMTPICNFYYDSVPGIFITGQVNSAFMRQDRALRQVGFQEWPASDAFSHVTKWNLCVKKPEIIRWVMDKALWECCYGRPGPVHLDIPLDVQRAQINPNDLQEYTPEVPFYSGGLHAQVEEFIEDFRKAQRPVVLIGGGVRGTQALIALDALAEMMRCPFFPTWNALDVVTSEHPWYGGRVGTYGGAGRNFAIQNCDLLLCIGCRLSGRITGGNIESFARGAKRYVVDVDSSLLRRELQQLPFHVSIRNDATSFMQILENALRRYHIEQRTMPNHASWVAQVMRWKTLYPPIILRSEKDLPQGGIHPYHFAAELSGLLPANAIIVYDCGGNAVVMNHTFETKRGQRYFSNNGNSPMGFAFCASIGAALAAPERPVVCVIGDGGFINNVQEVQTLLNYGVKNLKTFILDNRIYGITKQFQETHFGGRFEASGPKGYNPPESFNRLVQGFGGDIQGRVKSWAICGGDLGEHIKDVLQRITGSVICTVQCPEYKTYEPRIAGAHTPIEDMVPPLPREEFRRNMVGVEPLPGWETCSYGPYHVS